MEQKKLTRAQIEKRLKEAVVLVEKTKDTQSVFFSDKGLRLTVNSNFAVVETGYHRHVFDSFTSQGMSRPWIYTKRIVELALGNECATETGLSYGKMLNTLYAKEGREEYNIAKYFEMWAFNCFQPIYGIGETEAEAFLVFEDYVHNLARNVVLLDKRNEDITNVEYFKRVVKNMEDFVKDNEERVIFQKMTDEELMNENIEAIQQQEAEDAVKEAQDGETV